MLGAAVVTGVLIAVSNRLCDQLGLTLAADLRESAMDKALRIDAATLEQAGTGDVTSRITEDVELINASVKVTAGVFTALVTVVFTVVGFVVAGLAAGAGVPDACSSCTPSGCAVSCGGRVRCTPPTEPPPAPVPRRC